MTKVLIAESLDEKILAEFQSRTAIEFVYQPDISLSQPLKAYDGLIVRPKPVSAEFINNSDLKIIIRGGAGVNSIDLAACRNKGVIVENTPGLNSDATAEFTILLMLQTFTKRQAERANELSRNGSPGTPEEYMGNELKGKKLGLVGLGNIGTRVAKIAGGFGMDVMAYVRSPKQSSITQFSTLDELLSAGCDIISLHIPLSSETTGIISEKQFSLMKKGTVLINTARPQLVDVTAFTAAIKSGQISSFGIDGDYDLIEPYIKADPDKKGIATHHIADSTYEAQANITTQALTQMIAYLEHGKEINRVA